MNPKILLCFSLKCGLLVGENLEEKISEEDQEFVDAVIDAIKSEDQHNINQLYDAGMEMT